MIVSSIPRLTSLNSAYGVMDATNSLRGLMGSSTSFGNKTLLNAERTLFGGKQANELLYKTGLLMDDVARKLQKENIKRSFSTFA